MVDSVQNHGTTIEKGRGLRASTPAFVPVDESGKVKEFGDFEEGKIQG